MTLPRLTHAERTKMALTFLEDYPNETIAVAARIHDIKPNTLQRTLSRPTVIASGRGGHNRILDKAQAVAIHNLCKSLIASAIPPTHSVIFAAIQYLKKQQLGDSYQGPTQAWFRKWWKDNKLHTIKSRPLARIRVGAQNEEEIRQWHQDYKTILRELDIKRNHIDNFDEKGVRVGCMRNMKVLVPTEVLEFYHISPEDRRSITIFECICASGSYPIPPLVVIEGKQVMDYWVPEELPTGTLVIESPSGFTSDSIAIVWLKHYIEWIGWGPKKEEWRLLLMDNHGSHCTEEFIALANTNKIRPYPLIPHATHCMQPLDVGCFRSFEHWRQDMIQKSIGSLSLEYGILHFMRDLHQIREKTFTKETIRHAFRDAGMYPPSVEKTVQLAKKYGIKETQKTTLELPSHPGLTPKTPLDVSNGTAFWVDKVLKAKPRWSSPTREAQFQDFKDAVIQVQTESLVIQFELGIHQKHRQEDISNKKNTRKRLRPTGGISGLTREDAIQMRKDREKKEAKQEQAREKQAFLIIWRTERDLVNKQGIQARKEERKRLKTIKNLLKEKREVPLELGIPIIDPSINWKATDETFLELEAQKAIKREGRGLQSIEEEDIQITIDVTGDIALQADFLPFPEFELNSDSSDSEGSDSEGEGAVTIDFGKY